MSRTYRRKNYELQNANSWRGGGKSAGYYTEEDWHYQKVTEENIKGVDPKDIRYSEYSGCYFLHYTTYREPTKKEYFKRWYYAHGESRTSMERSPNSYHRQFRVRQNRNINKREIKIYLKNQNYEPMCEEKVRRCLWDWN